MSVIKEVEGLSNDLGSTFVGVELKPGCYSLGNVLYDTEIDNVRKAILKHFGQSKITFLRGDSLGGESSIYTIFIVKDIK